MEEKIDKLIQSKYHSCYQEDRDFLIDLFNVLKKYEIQNYGYIVLKLDEAKEIASLITTI